MLSSQNKDMQMLDGHSLVVNVRASTEISRLPGHAVGGQTHKMLHCMHDHPRKYLAASSCASIIAKRRELGLLGERYRSYIF